MDHRIPVSGKHHKVVSLTIALGVAGLLVYAALAGRTDSWPTTDCVVAGNRVIRADGPFGLHGETVRMYKGQYELAYRIAGQEYFVWADSGWFDPEESFVEGKVASLPEPCPFRIRYNPRNPADAFPVRK